MAISLANLQRGGVVRPPMLLVYGTKGIGKSTIGADAPSPIFLDVEDGLTTIPVSRIPIPSFDTAMEAILALYQQEHEFRTVVVDSLDFLEEKIWKAVCAAHNVDSIEKVEKGYGKGYVIALDYWRQFLDGLKLLRDERGMAILMLAHPQIKKFDSPEHEPYDQYGLRLHKGAMELLQAASDAVLFANYRVSTVKSDAGFNRKAVRAVGAGDRVLHTTERPAFAAKNRFKMPDTLDMTWQAIAEHIPFFQTSASQAA